MKRAKMDGTEPQDVKEFRMLLKNGGDKLAGWRLQVSFTSTYFFFHYFFFLFTFVPSSLIACPGGTLCGHGFSTVCLLFLQLWWWLQILQPCAVSSALLNSFGFCPDGAACLTLCCSVDWMVRFEFYLAVYELRFLSFLYVQIKIELWPLTLLLWAFFCRTLASSCTSAKKLLFFFK